MIKLELLKDKFNKILFFESLIFIIFTFILIVINTSRMNFDAIANYVILMTFFVMGLFLTGVIPNSLISEKNKYIIKRSIQIYACICLIISFISIISISKPDIFHLFFVGSSGLSLGALHIF